MYTLETDFQEFIAAACQKVAPLWPLSHFVAVNPFLGYTQQSFESAAHEHQRVLEVAMLSNLRGVSAAIRGRRDFGGRSHCGYRAFI